jgi:N-acyl-phosphatidylethanolamine-hydrolysing phospholipase D
MDTTRPTRSQHHRDMAHRTGSGFHNSNPEAATPGILAFLKWRLSRLWKTVPRASQYHFSTARNDPEFLRANHTLKTVTWIGHATLLLQLHGINVLTDPQFSERASPVQWLGPRRVIVPGVPLAELPPIDIVVISHDHYDSLDRPTIRALRAREGGTKTLFFVPLGLKEWFTDLDVTQVVEMDWWNQYHTKGLTVIATPAQHWSKRNVFSRNKTLWCGWAIQSSGFRFYFVGDSGYSPLFKEIGSTLGPFDLAAIPIGAYEPRWFMGRHHMSPEEAVQVHQDVQSQKSIAMHWGTFILTDEPLDEPPRRLERAKTARNIADQDFIVLRHGQTIVLD